jgi:hypothetical protein
LALCCNGELFVITNHKSCDSVPSWNWKCNKLTFIFRAFFSCICHEEKAVRAKKILVMIQLEKNMKKQEQVEDEEEI